MLLPVHTQRESTPLHETRLYLCDRQRYPLHPPPDRSNHRQHHGRPVSSSRKTPAKLSSSYRSMLRSPLLPLDAESLRVAPSQPERYFSLRCDLIGSRPNMWYVGHVVADAPLLSTRRYFARMRADNPPAKAGQLRGRTTGRSMRCSFLLPLCFCALGFNASHRYPWLANSNAVC